MRCNLPWRWMTAVALIVGLIGIARPADAAVVVGGPGTDLLFGTNNDDTITAEDGLDFLLAKGGDDTLFGGDDSDQLLLGPGEDTAEGQGGADSIYDDDGTSGDVLRGGPGDDHLFSGDGAADFVSCGAGDADEAVADFTDHVVDCEFVANVTGEVVGGVRVRFGTNRADEFIGSAEPTYFFARRGNDRVTGGSGENELALLGHGRDTAVMGAGTDVVVVDDEIAGDTVKTGPGADRVFAANGVKTTVNCGAGEEDVFADPFDVLTGCEIEHTETEHL